MKCDSPRKAGTTASSSSPSSHGWKATSPPASSTSVTTVLALAQHLAHEHGAGEGLAAGALQLVVEGAVFELVQVELGGVLHEADGRLVGEQVAEQRVEQGHAAAQGIGQQHQAKLQRHQREHGRELRAAAAGSLAEGHHVINNQLAHVEHGQRQKRPHQAQRNVGQGQRRGWCAR